MAWFSRGDDLSLPLIVLAENSAGRPRRPHAACRPTCYLLRFGSIWCSLHHSALIKYPLCPNVSDSLSLSHLRRTRFSDTWRTSPTSQSGELWATGSLIPSTALRWSPSRYRRLKTLAEEIRFEGWAKEPGQKAPLVRGRAPAPTSSKAPSSNTGLNEKSKSIKTSVRRG